MAIVYEISYWLTWVLVILAFIAAIIGFLIGNVRLWALLFEWYLAARKLKEIYREFMVDYVRKNGGIKRRSRE